MLHWTCYILVLATICQSCLLVYLWVAYKAAHIAHKELEHKVVRELGEQHD